MARLEFGTDGIRGRAGRFPIDAPTAQALGRVLGRGGRRVLLARDSRSSGPALVEALAAGVQAAGGLAESLGLLPTPALSVALASGWGSRGVMVTASHNPAADNGLKVLGADGRKLADSQQDALEESLNRCLAEQPAPAELLRDQPLGPRVQAAMANYLQHLARALPPGRWLEGQAVVVDGAHGSGAHSAPALLARLGARVIPIHCSPDGERINLDCGALHTADLARAVLVEGADWGMALDGDADRGLMVSASGRVLDGDAMLYLLARPPAVVGTVMSGAGLEQALAARGIHLHRTAVGDRFVDAALHEHGLDVGAETSGHVCLADGLPTACGTLSCLRVLVGGPDLDARLADYRPWPRRQLNVAVRDRPPLDRQPAIVAAQDHALQLLGPGGRVLLRYSGTAPLLRILTAGREAARVEQAALDLARGARATL